MRKKPDPFYKLKAWIRTRAWVLARDNHLCQHCLRKKKLKKAVTVHHIKPRSLFPELALDVTNLVSLCFSCHNKIHFKKKVGLQEVVKEKRGRKARIIKSLANPPLPDELK